MWESGGYLGGVRARTRAENVANELRSAPSFANPHPLPKSFTFRCDPTAPRTGILLWTQTGLTFICVDDDAMITHIVDRVINGLVGTIYLQ